MAKEHFTTLELKSPSGFSYCAYDNIKDTSILTDVHVGKRVMVAGYKTTAKFYLKSCHTKGDLYHPTHNTYTVRTNNGMERVFYSDQCRLHPAEYRKGKRWQR
jgi:hypothetical protein